MFNQRVHSSWSFFSWWVLTNVLNIAVGIALGWVVTMNVAEILVDLWPLPRRSVLFLGLWLVVGIDWVLVLAGVVGGMVIGALTGEMQWLVLRWQTNLDDFNWVWASMVGWGLGFAVFSAITLIEGGITSAVVITTVAGGVVGFVQWLVLKRHAAQANCNYSAPH